MNTIEATHRTLDACAALRRCGCRIVAAHAHEGAPVVAIDRPRGPMACQPVRVDRGQCVAAWGPVRVEWRT